MSDKEQEANEASAAPVTIHAQYIKDLSVENPHAPESLRMQGGEPIMNVEYSLEAKKIKGEKDKDAASSNTYEVSLTTTLTAKNDNKTILIVELQYAILCTIGSMPEDSIKPFLMIEMPRMIFPYVRQIIANQTADAGFFPFYMVPVNFKALYMQKLQAEEQIKNKTEATN